MTPKKQCGSAHGLCLPVAQPAAYTGSHKENTRCPPVQHLDPARLPRLGLPPRHRSYRRQRHHLCCSGHTPVPPPSASGHRAARRTRQGCSSSSLSRCGVPLPRRWPPTPTASTRPGRAHQATARHRVHVLSSPAAAAGSCALKDKQKQQEAAVANGAARPGKLSAGELRIQKGACGWGGGRPASAGAWGARSAAMHRAQHV